MKKPSSINLQAAQLKGVGGGEDAIDLVSW
jgi:hypothetical protein